MPLRPCLGWQHEPCGKLSPNTRCPRHDHMRRQASNARYRPHRERRPDYTSQERTRRAEAVAAWRAMHGDVCPGWQRPPHPASDLTADHPIEVAAGGSEGQDLMVLCRSCNSSKGGGIRRA